MISQEQYQAIMIMAKILTNQFKRTRTLTSIDFKLLVGDAIHTTIEKLSEEK